MRDGFWYLATPYQKYYEGLDAAYDAALANATLLTGHGLFVFAPIVHSHPIQTNSLMRYANTTDIPWLQFDRMIAERAKGLIVCKLDGWKESHGVNQELIWFAEWQRPIIFMEPGMVPIEFLV